MHYCIILSLLFSVLIHKTNCTKESNSSLSANTVVENSTLRLVNVLYRHGDRTPIQSYPNDPYNNLSFWPVSWGQLTNEGKRRHFNLGQYMRQRYENFLSKNFSPEEIYVRSTDVDRTLMSAESHLAGLYPPKGGQVWNPSLKWQPIPVHTVPQQEDLLLRLDSVCPRYDELVKELNSSPEIQEKLEQNKVLFEYISKHSGLNVSTFEDIEYLYDVLFIESRYNMTLPNWTLEVFPSKLKPLSDFSFVMKAYNLPMQRLRGGPLVKEITSHMSMLASGTLQPTSRKLFMYSAHDVTLATFLSALNVFDNIQPPYASLVIVELHEKSPGKHFVQVLYKNVSDDGLEPYVLTLPSCSEFCPLETFVQLTRSVISDDVSAECKRPTNVQLLTEISVLVIGVLAAFDFIFLVVIVAGCLFWHRQKRTNGYNYSIISAE